MSENCHPRRKGGVARHRNDGGYSLGFREYCQVMKPGTDERGLSNSACNRVIEYMFLKHAK